LREYSIPHLRRSGRISIPEESFERIREARDLHKEGLGTESVRRLLREGGGPHTGELKEQLDQLSENLESLRGNEKPGAGGAPPSHALRTILARQNLLISAMFNLTEMVEELLLASGKPRKTVFEEVEGEIREVALPSRRLRSNPRRAVPPGSAPRALPRPSASPATRAEKFGSLARRRRRTSLALLLSALVAGALLLLALPKLGGGELSAGISSPGDQAQERPQSPPEEGQAPGDAAARAPSAGGEGPGADTAASEVVETGPGEVPDVSGRDVAEAARALSAAGYEVAAVQTVKSEEEAGTVVRTEPTAGSAVQPGDPVFLIMSGGSSGTRTGP